jgi:ribosomal protein S18 acetylase RimI-like enzyme
MNHTKDDTSFEITDSQYVSHGGMLSLSNMGQLELLLAMTEKGASLRTTARGFSMQPFIRDKDILTISPLKDRQPVLGDVVAFTQPFTERLAIHRIIGKTDKGWLIKGDNGDAPDGIIPNEKIIGRVCRIERNGKEKNLGIGRAGVLIAILNRGNTLLRLKRLMILPQRTAGYVLQNIQSLTIYRWFGKLFASGISISVANEEDMEAVHHMFNPDVPYQREKPNPNVINWVAKRKGRVIGFTQNVYHPKEHHPWVGHWLFSLHVRVRYRGTGIGEKLTMRSLNKAKELGAAEIFLVVFEDNIKAVNLYKKQGFVNIVLPALEPLLAAEKIKFGRRRVVMRKVLRQVP